jgi:hypothetical protein
VIASYSASSDQPAALAASTSAWRIWLDWWTTLATKWNSARSASEIGAVA